jgi:hypothetical protein
VYNIGRYVDETEVLIIVLKGVNREDNGEIWNDVSFREAKKKIINTSRVELQCG